MKSGLFLDVVIRKSATIFQLLASEDQPLLVGWDAFFVLDLCFDILNAVRWLDFQGDGLSCQSFDEDLHATAETQNEMESGLLLDIVVGQSTAILELFACEDEPLLVRRDSFFVLNFRLDILDAVRWFHLERDGLSCQCFDEDLHSSSETQNEMKSGLLLDVVVRKCAAIL